MKDIIKRNITGKKVLLLFIVTNVIYLIMLMVTIPKVMAYSNGMKILDMMPTGYSSDYVNELLGTLEAAGRNAYLFNQIPLDMIYPALFGISNCLVLAYFLNKLGKTEGFLFYLCFIPLFSGLFDYCENIGIIMMLKNYPEAILAFAPATNVFSILKSSFTMVYFVVLISTLFVFGINLMSSKQK